MTPPTVSVVMSVYNGSRHLRQSVDSILAQTLGDLEFVIVNDGSTDATADILHGYDDARIRLIEHEDNRGLTRSLIEAIDACGGDYIARQDADDTSSSERLQAQVDFLRSNPRVAAVGTWARQIDDDGDEIAVLERAADPEDIRRGLAWENQFHHGSVMFRRSALDQIGGYRPRFRYAQDYDLFLRLVRDFDLANLDRPLYSKRHTPDAVSIVHAAEQKRYADLALALYRQRVATGADDLDSGLPVESLLDTGVEKQGGYEKSLVYLYLRSDKCEKARPYLLNNIRRTPYSLKPYLQYGLTFLNRGARDRLFRLWDHGQG